MTDQEQLTAQVGSAIEKIMGYVESGVDLASDQAPLVAVEIVNRAIALSTLQAGCFGLLVVIGAALFVYGMRMSPERKEHDEEIAPLITGAVVAVFFTIPAACGVADLVSALTAPRLLVMKTLANLL